MQFCYIMNVQLSPIAESSSPFNSVHFPDYAISCTATEDFEVPHTKIPYLLNSFLYRVSELGTPALCSAYGAASAPRFMWHFYEIV
jgi:hypothetical protein